MKKIIVLCLAACALALSACGSRCDAPEVEGYGNLAVPFLMSHSDVMLMGGELPVSADLGDFAGTSVTVSGAGAVDVAPDIAHVSMSISTRDMDAQTALIENNANMNALIDAIVALGVSEDDIRTTSFNVHRAYDWSARDEWGNFVRSFLGYDITNSIRITVRDIDIVGRVLGTATAQGAMPLGGVTFAITDSTPVYQTALALSVQDALGKAEAIAATLGKTRIVAVSVIETGGMHQPVRRDYDMPVMEMMDEDASMAVPVHAGELSVTARVQVEFRLFP